MTHDELRVIYERTRAAFLEVKEWVLLCSVVRVDEMTAIAKPLYLRAKRELWCPANKVWLIGLDAAGKAAAMGGEFNIGWPDWFKPEGKGTP